MPGRVLDDSVVDIIRNLESRIGILESSGWAIPPGGALTFRDDNDITRVIIGVMADGTAGVRVYDSSSVLQLDETYS